MDNSNQPQPSTDQSTEQPVVPTPNPNKSKLLPVLIIVLFIVLIPSGAYILGSKNILTQPKQTVIVPTIIQKSPTPAPSIDPTANWKTYTNTDIGFSVKYSETIDETYLSSGSSMVNIYLPNLNTKHVLEENMRISDSVDTYATLKEAVDNSISQDTNGIRNRFKIDRYRYALAGITGELLIDETSPLNNYSPNRLQSRSVWIQYKKTILVFGVMYRSENKEKTLEYFDQILSTFKFLDQNQATNTSNWKTYKNRNYGFELHYPEVFKLSDRGRVSEGNEYWLTDDYWVTIIASDGEWMNIFLFNNVLISLDEFSTGIFDPYNMNTKPKKFSILNKDMQEVTTTGRGKRMILSWVDSVRQRGVRFEIPVNSKNLESYYGIIESFRFL